MAEIVAEMVEDAVGRTTTNPLAEDTDAAVVPDFFKLVRPVLTRKGGTKVGVPVYCAWFGGACALLSNFITAADSLGARTNFVSTHGMRACKMLV